MKIQIRNRWDAERVLYEGEHESVKDAVIAAVEADANLARANLARAYLAGADLSDSTALPEGVTFGEFKSAVLPALLTAGGKDLMSYEQPWQCNGWSNCPMHHAFNACGISEVPVVWRPWANRFVQLFDAKLLPWSLVLGLVEAA